MFNTPNYSNVGFKIGTTADILQKCRKKEFSLPAKLDPDRISELEDGIRSHNPTAAYEYMWDTLRFHLDSQPEIHRRTKVLLSVRPETTTPLICLAVISAANDKPDLWQLTQKRVGESEPGLGYLAWRSILAFRMNEAQAESWFHVVEQSARFGHLPSKRVILAKRFKKARMLERISIRFRLAFNVLQDGLIERRDKKDRRIAKYFKA